MMKNFIKTLFILSLLVGYSSCEKDKPVLTYQGNDFIFFNETSGSVQESDASVSYIIVKLAAGAQGSAVTVDFTVASDNAVEGTDFEILNDSETLTFAPGSYTDTIKIRSKDNLVEDGSKLITFTLANGGTFNLGYEGPDANNSIFEFTIVDDDCTFIADDFTGAPSGVEAFAYKGEYVTDVTFKKISEVGSIVTYEVSGIMASIFAGWDESVDPNLPSGGDKVNFIFDNTNPLDPVITISGVPSITAGEFNLTTTNGGAWIYDITLDDSKVSTFSTCEKTAEIYYLIDVSEPGTWYETDVCYLKLDFKE